MQIARCHQFITGGIVVVLDPSIGSHSSQPGVAVYVRGELRENGVLPVNPNDSVPERLQQVTHHLRKLYAKWEPDVLVFEQIPAQRYGGGNARAHASLLMALGASLAVSGPEHYVGIQPVSWKTMISPEYVKSDAGDAKEIGRIAVDEARRIGSVEQSKKETKKAKRTKA